MKKKKTEWVLSVEDKRHLEGTIGYIFNDPDLLKVALTHKSFVGEHKEATSYERLEFLGDAVLQLITSHRLYFENQGDEGHLSLARADMVCESTLAEAVRNLGLGDYIFFGYGEAKNGGKERSRILCNVFESVLGAVYLDGGIASAFRFVERYLMEKPEDKDYKSLLQELVQKYGQELPEYRLIGEEGPAHERIFTMGLYYQDKEYAIASGKSKKAAEQAAAQSAFAVIQKYLEKKK